MSWIPRTFSVFVIIAVVVHCSLPAVAANGATIQGTVKTPCDPSRASDVVSVQIRRVPGGSAATAVVDSSTGAFRLSGLTEGEYELIAIGTDGEPLSPEPKKLVLVSGLNTIVLSMQPPGCGDQDADGDGVPDALDSCPDTPPGEAVGTDGCPVQGGKRPGGKRGLKDWQVTLVYLGAIGAIVLALDAIDEEEASPFRQ
jgi:hypothetical protein